MVDATGWNPLHAAALEGHTEAGQALLDSCPSLVEGRDKLGRTPALLAAEHNHAQFIEFLLENDIDLSSHKDTKGWGISHYASVFCDKALLENLHSAGVSLSQTDDLGRTPLHWAAALGKLGVISMLTLELDYFDDAFKEDNAGRTPKDLAWLFGQRQAANKLIFITQDTESGSTSGSSFDDDYEDEDEEVEDDWDEDEDEGDGVEIGESDSESDSSSESDSDEAESPQPSPTPIIFRNPGTPIPSAFPKYTPTPIVNTSPPKSDVKEPVVVKPPSFESSDEDSWESEEESPNAPRSASPPPIALPVAASISKSLDSPKSRRKLNFKDDKKTTLDIYEDDGLGVRKAHSAGDLPKLDKKGSPVKQSPQFIPKPVIVTPKKSDLRDFDAFVSKLQEEEREFNEKLKEIRETESEKLASIIAANDQKIHECESFIRVHGIEAVTTTLTAMEKLKLLRNAKNELIMRHEDVKKELWKSDAERVTLQVQKNFMEARTAASLIKTGHSMDMPAEELRASATFATLNQLVIALQIAFLTLILYSTIS